MYVVLDMAVVLSFLGATIKIFLLTNTYFLCHHVCCSNDRKEDTYDYVQDRSTKRYDELGSF